MSTKPTPNYLRSGAEQAPHTRVQINRGRHKVVFVDPPLTGHWWARRALVQFIYEAFLAGAVFALFCAGWHLSLRVFLFCLMGFMAIKAFLAVRRWRQVTRDPTIIEVTPASVNVTAPGAAPLAIAINELHGIRSSRPRHLLGTRGKMSSLVISARGRRLRLLRFRDDVEVRWLARRLREAIENFRNDPTSKVSADAEAVGEEGQARFLQSTDARSALPTPRAKLWREALRREYEDSGCATALCLLFLAVAGLVIISLGADDLVICLEFGSDAFFRQGLHRAPHGGYFGLTNGHVVSAPFQLLWILLFMVGLPLWQAAWIVIVLSLHRWHREYRERKERALRAKLRS